VGLITIKHLPRWSGPPGNAVNHRWRAHRCTLGPDRSRQGRQWPHRQLSARFLRSGPIRAKSQRTAG